MAMGKIVMAGNRREAREALGVDACPILPIRPDVDAIYEQMKWIVLNREKIPELGYNSRIYVEQVHDHVKIAQRYIDAWKSVNR